MKLANSQTGSGLVAMMIGIAIVTAILLASTTSVISATKAQRDTDSNAEIGALFDRVQLIVGNQWSCTASLAGQVFSGSGSVVIMDPVVSTQVVAAQTNSPSSFWHVSQISIQNAEPVSGQPGVFSGALFLQATKNMKVQMGSPFLSRSIPNLVFAASSGGTITRCYPGTNTLAMAQAACQGLGGAWNPSGSQGTQCSLPTPSPSPSPSPSATPVSCLESTGGIVVLPNSNLVISGNAKVQGDIDLLNNSDLSMSGNAKVGGTVYPGAGALVSMSGNCAATQAPASDLTQLSASIASLVAFEGALAPTSRMTTVNGTQTLSGNGGQNVISVSGDLSLSGNDVLTLAGGAKDIFVFNISGKITVSGNASISLKGVSAQNVLFNNIGNGNEIVISGNGATSGTFIAALRGAELSGNGSLNGAVIAGGGAKSQVTVSGNGLTMNPAPFCVQ